MALEVVNILSETEKSAELRYVCLVSERAAVKFALTGGVQSVGGSLQNIAPAPYPYNATAGTNFVCQSVKFSGMGEVFGSPPKIFVDVTFAPPTKDQEEDDGDPWDLFSVSLSVAAEGVQIPKQNYTIDDVSAGDKNGETLTEEEMSIQKWISSIELTLSSDRMQTFKASTMCDKIAKVNSSTFTIPSPNDSASEKQFAAGTVLFLGYSADQKTSSDGYDYATRSLVFNIKKNGGKGHNAIWLPSAAAFVTVDPPIYESTSFDDLFTN